MNRRSFIASILAAGVAPAFVGSSILMPVRQIITPTWIQRRQNIYVSPQGSDANDGLSWRTPLATFAAAAKMVEVEDHIWVMDVVLPHTPITIPHGVNLTFNDCTFTFTPDKHTVIYEPTGNV